MIAADSIDYFTAVDKALIRSVLYFDIFNYPITAEEARAFAPLPITSDCDQRLDHLVTEGILFKLGSFYSVQNDQTLAHRRLEGNRLAEKRMNEARKFSQLIASFPFVRAVMLSGSISKNFMEPNSDIDYFIITEAKRLWVVRTALVIFRRICLFNSIRNFCVNYFVDTDNLMIPDRNIFVATELATLKSMYGESMMQRFRSENQWIRKILPQGSFDTNETRDKGFFMKEAIERTARLLPMDGLNRWLMNFFKTRWEKRYAEQFIENDFEIAFRTKEGVSKSHPHFFQKRALDQVENKVRAFEHAHRVDLTL